MPAARSDAGRFAYPSDVGRREDTRPGMALLDRLARLAQARSELRAKKAASEENVESTAELCARIRGFMHPGQVRMFSRRPGATLKATIKGRRAGATSGGCREALCRAIETANCRETYVTTTRIEAKARAWNSDTQSGFADLVDQYGTRLERGGVPTYSLGGIIVEVREAELALEFSNGSKIDLFGADDEGALGKQRGNAKHLYWIDEAQDFWWLERFYKAVVVAAMVDSKPLTGFDGECWLTGTPGVDCSGMFYEITGGDEPLPGWETHVLSVRDNPFFGATPEERWESTAVAVKRKNAWEEDDPDYQREWYGKWVRSDARYVYEVHKVPLAELCYAPVREQADGFPDIRAAIDDLPGRHPEQGVPRDYFLAMGADLGTRDAFALVVWAYSQMDPNLYELASWKMPGLDYDEMALHLNAINAQAYCGLVTADAGGGGKPAVMGWSRKWMEQYGIAILEATKPNKAIAIKQLNTEIRRRRIKFREDSLLLRSMQRHRWSPKRTSTGAIIEDPATHEWSDTPDAGLYSYRECYPYRWHEEEKKSPPGSRERYAQEAAELERAALGL